MGACILCGKSAGPFYSLHKNCYAKYESSKKEIAGLLAEEFGATQPSLLASKINEYIAECGFVAEAQQRTLNRALEFFTSQYLETTQLTASLIQAWIDVLDILSPNESLFVNPHFISQQYNLHALQQLNNFSLPESNRHPANYSITLREQEVLWWCFDKSEIEQELPIESKRQWSVMMQIVNSMLTKGRKASVEKTSVGGGKLLITNQRIFFENEKDAREIGYHEIYSVSPVKNGVCLQSKRGSSIPEIYICEDARLLYGFIKYAQQHHLSES